MLIKFILILIIFVSGCNNNKDIITEKSKPEKFEQNYYSVFCFMDNVSGLNTNDEVLLDNKVSGYISSINIVKDKVKIELKIKKNITVFEDSEFVIDFLNNNKIVLQIISPENKVIPLKPESNVYGINKIQNTEVEFVL